MLRPVLTATITIASVISGAQAVSSDRDRPLQVLVITGGGPHHDFENVTPLLLDALSTSHEDAFEFDVVWIGDETPDRFHGGPELADGELFADYDTIVAFTQGDLGFTDRTRERFLEYVSAGGGYVAIHSAAGSHPGWDEYDRLLGGRFDSHPPFGEMTVRIDVTEHDLTRGLPREWTLQDEFYHLRNSAEDAKLVLMRGRSPADSGDAPLRPITWEKNYGAGRVFCTLLGHGPETHGDEHFQTLIARAIRWTAAAPGPGSDGVYDLYDGQTLEGWSMTGPGEFVIEDDGALLATGGMGMLWYHERRFRDFELTVEWKTEGRRDNSGVFVRFHEPPDSPWDAVHKGHEIQIYDDADGPHMTGAVYAHAPATTLASKEPGEWNVFEITVVGNDYTVVLNGETVCAWTGPAERHGREGYIGLQNHGSPVRFRTVTVRPLDTDG